MDYRLLGKDGGLRLPPAQEGEKFGLWFFGGCAKYCQLTRNLLRVFQTAFKIATCPGSSSQTGTIPIKTQSLPINMNRTSRKTLRRRLPGSKQIFASRWTKPFAPLFNKPYFWTLNRRQAAVSVAIGMFCGLMPGPTQMLSALMAAYFLRTNLPVAVFTTLYTNPLTYMPLYYAAYKIGSLILGTDTAEELAFPAWSDSSFFSELAQWLTGAGKPLLVGVPVLGGLLASAGYFAVLIGWRIRTQYQWNKRKNERG